MKYEMVRNLRGGEILADFVLDSQGKLLLVKGAKLTKGYINLLRQNFIYFVYIEDELNQPKPSNKINKIDKIKEEMLETMPNIFNELMSGDFSNIYRMGDFVNSIIEESNINTNLYEINQYDNYTYIHSINTGIMAVFLGTSMGLSKDQLKKLGMGAFLHDIGKIKIADRIINKKGTLTAEEFNEVKKHPIYGYNALKEAGITDMDVLSCVITHHERLDGKGYPLGLKGDRLSVYSKITSICDVFTAVSAHRSYRSRFSPNDAYECILSGAGTQFDLDIVEKFKETFAIYPIGCHVKLNNGVDGIVVGQNIGLPDRPIVEIKKEGSISGSGNTINLKEHTNLIIMYVF